ncbi:hypothetical protein MCELHM10_00452 [Paracoccaceae bacterium]|jgi:hypothetical protein
MKKLLLALTLAALPFAALAEDSPVVATYGTHNGSLPPEYAWDNYVVIHANGKMEVRHCKGYETDGPGCKTRRGKATPDAIEAIRAAALASGLAEKPAAESEDLMVGGGGAWGSVFLDGQEIKLMSEPAEADASRVNAVLSAVAAAIPDKFDRFMHPN